MKKINLVKFLTCLKFEGLEGILCLGSALVLRVIFKKGFLCMLHKGNHNIKVKNQTKHKSN